MPTLPLLLERLAHDLQEFGHSGATSTAMSVNAVRLCSTGKVAAPKRVRDASQRVLTEWSTAKLSDEKLAAVERVENSGALPSEEERRHLAERASHRAQVAEGLLLSLDTPRGREAAEKLVGPHRQREQLDAAIATDKLIVESMGFGPYPIRATSGKKGAFHGMHGRERAARKGTLIAGPPTATCVNCGSIMPSPDSTCPNCGHVPTVGDPVQFKPGGTGAEPTSPDLRPEVMEAAPAPAPAMGSSGYGSASAASGSVTTQTRSGGTVSWNPDVHPRKPKGLGGGQFIASGTGMNQAGGNTQVVQLQQRLNQLGYKTNPDGKYGALTTQAVLAFQRDHGIAQTGNLDKATIAALRSAQTQNAAYMRAIRPTTQELRAQTQLARLGYDLGLGSQGALLQFQKDHGLQQTGQADNATLTLLRAAVRMENTKNSKLNPAWSADQIPIAIQTRRRARSELPPTTLNPPHPTYRQRVEARRKKIRQARLREEVPMEEASYTNIKPPTPDGVRVPYGGAAGLAPIVVGGEENANDGDSNIDGSPAVPSRPPNLRESPPGEWSMCGNCVHWDGFKECLLYDWGTARDALCDAHLTLSPREATLHGAERLLVVQQARIEASRSGDAEAFERHYATERALREQLEEVSSDAYPGLDRSPKQNWVEKAGGLPRYIERIAKHLHYEKGNPIGTAIAVAVNVVKKMCATGDLNFPGKQTANPKSRAEACAAVADWEKKKAGSKGKDLAEAAKDVYDPSAEESFAIAEAAHDSALLDQLDEIEALEAEGLLDESSLPRFKSVVEGEWNPILHPRVRAGGHGGGQFINVFNSLAKAHNYSELHGRGGSPLKGVGKGSGVKLGSVHEPKPGGMASVRFKTHAQEKAEAWQKLVSSPFKGTHEYRPGLMDLTSPNVISGHAIKQGEPVRILRGGRGQEKVDPLGKIVHVQDAHGNIQSVWKAALQRPGRMESPATMPAMSAGHFQNIAHTISGLSSDAQRQRVAQHFSEHLRASNPRFDQARFLTAATTGKGAKETKTKMSRQHFEALAGMIHSLPSYHHADVASAFAGSLGRTNENFDQARFMRAATDGGTGRLKVGMASPSHARVVAMERSLRAHIAHDQHDSSKRGGGGSGGVRLHQETLSREQEHVRDRMSSRGMASPAQGGGVGHAETKSGPLWRFLDNTGVERYGHIVNTFDHGGSDVTYHFRDTGGRLHSIGGQRVKEHAHVVPNLTPSQVKADMKRYGHVAGWRDTSRGPKDEKPSGTSLGDRLSRGMVSPAHSESGAKGADTFGASVKTMPLHEIAGHIESDWGSKGSGVNYAARPYLSAMRHLGSTKDSFGMDSGKSVVAYFLSNASGYRGDKAKAIKAELKRRLRESGDIKALSLVRKIEEATEAKLARHKQEDIVGFYQEKAREDTLREQFHVHVPLDEGFLDEVKKQTEAEAAKAE